MCRGRVAREDQSRSELFDGKNCNPFVQSVGATAWVNHVEVLQAQVVDGNALGLGYTRRVSIPNLHAVTSATDEEQEVQFRAGLRPQNERCARRPTLESLRLRIPPRRHQVWDAPPGIGTTERPEARVIVLYLEYRFWES